MSAGHTEGEWEIRGRELLGKELIDEDGDAVRLIIAVSNSWTTDDVESKANARLIVAACNSYDRHFGPRAIEAAEADLLGRALEALRMAAPLLAEAREALCGRDDVCTTSDGDDALLPLRDAINFILSQAREVK